MKTTIANFVFLKRVVWKILSFLIGFPKLALPLLLVFILLLLNLQPAYTAEFSHHVFSTKDGLPSNTVYACLQDRNGDMWFATECGLSRFNGFSFQNYQLKDGMPDSEVLKMFEDRRGRIWLAHSNGTLSFLENGKFWTPQNFPLLGSLKVSSFFNGFLEDNEGSMWFTSLDDGIFHWGKNGQIRRLKPVAELAGSVVYPGIWKDETGQIRVCTQAGIVNIKKDPTIAEVPLSSGNDEIRYCKQLFNGNILVGFGRKILVYNSGSGVIREIGYAEGYDDYFISGITESAEGHLWISAINGLHFFRKGRLQKDAHRVFFHGKTLSGSRFDRQGNLWLTTLNEGVILVTDLESIRFGQEDGIPDVPVTSLLYHSDKLFWGNDRGSVGIIQNQLTTCLQGATALSQYGRGRVREFVAAPDNPKEVWAASENGLMAYNQNGLQGFFGSPSKCMAFFKDELFLGNAKSCVKINFNKLRSTGSLIIKELQKNQPNSKLIEASFRKTWNEVNYLLPPTRVYKLAVDISETIWMATHSGLYSYKNGKVRYWKEQSKELGNPFETMCLFRNQVLLGSNGRGILQLKDDGKIQWINSQSGLSSDYIRNIRTSGKDSIWVCTSSGLNLLTLEKNKSGFRIETWTKDNSSLPQDDVFDIAFHRDTAWLASGTAVICIPSVDLLRRPPALFPEIERIDINGKLFTGNPKSLRAEPGDLLEIRLRNSDYRHSVSARFVYRLLPEDTVWKYLSGNLIREKIQSAGTALLQLRNLSDKGHFEQFQLAEIQSGNILQQISPATGISQKNFILFLIPVLLLLFSWYLHFRLDRRGPPDSIHEGFRKQLLEMQLRLIQHPNPPSAAGEALLRFRSSLVDIQPPFPYQKELVLCRAYADFLKCCDPESNVFFDAGSLHETHRYESYSFLSFLMEKLIPFQTGKQSYVFRIRMKDRKMHLSISIESAGQIQLLPEGSRVVQLQQESILNRLLRHLKLLFP